MHTQEHAQNTYTRKPARNQTFSLLSKHGTTKHTATWRLRSRTYSSTERPISLSPMRGTTASLPLLPSSHGSTPQQCPIVIITVAFQLLATCCPGIRHHVTLPKPRELCHSLLLLPKLIVCYHCCCCYFDAILYAQPFGLG